MTTKYFFKYRLADELTTTVKTLVDYNTAREMCSWYWRNAKAESFMIIDENMVVVMVRIRGKGTGSKHIPYTNR